MRRTRFCAVLIASAFSACFASFLVSASLKQRRSQDGTSAGDVTPILRLEKPKYLLGEAVRFWVGVEPKNAPVIPREAWRPCSLEITKPDGSTETQLVSWPSDGMPSRGWSGGWSLDGNRAGSYLLVLECGGEKTKPLELIVERNEISNQISAEFRFERSGVINIGTPVRVVLAVQNNSPNTIQFPERGAMSEGVSLRVIRNNPAFRADFFYPWEKLASSSALPDTYTWDVASDIPSVVLKPGEHFEQHFVL